VGVICAIPAIVVNIRIGKSVKGSAERFTIALSQLSAEAESVRREEGPHFRARSSQREGFHVSAVFYARYAHTHIGDLRANAIVTTVLSQAGSNIERRGGY
jgi:hypothetical protein